MHLNLSSPVFTNLIGLAAVAIGGWLVRVISSPKDHDRAVALTHIATGAAALVVSLNPTATWAELLAMVVNQVASSAGLPTDNKDAIERAAAAALIAAGKAPGA